MLKDKLLQQYKTMSLIRNCEEILAQHFRDNRIMSFIHFYVGQEAVATGVCSELSHDDCVFGNHRSHGHYLAKGGCPKRMMAEILGKETGCCKGFGGSMHMIDKSVNFLGSTPILGSVAPIAAGSALKQKMKGEKHITCAFIGDGASEEGVVYETINLAALMDLPYLLVIENNLYSVMTKLEHRRSSRHYTRSIINGFGAHYIQCNGNSVHAVAESTKEALDYIKRYQMPVVLECMTYRHMAHSAPIFDDQVGYRVEDTKEVRDKVDPICAVEQIWLDNQWDIRELITVFKDTANIAKESLEFAINSPQPPATNRFNHVYV